MDGDVNLNKTRHREFESSLDYWEGAFDDSFDDTKRHFEMLNTVLPIVKYLSPNTILTVGDNRGRDAAFFKRFAGANVTASDLDIGKLIPAKNDGHIDECCILDVEHMDFADNSFDLVVIKESFHHWPRPMLGFYESLRVAKYGVVLIEPFDCVWDKDCHPYVQPGDYGDSYEKVGNYKYQISLREILKSSWSLYLSTVVTKGFNDPYKADYSFDSWLKEKNVLDLMGEQGHRQFNLMSIFVEKEKGCLDTESLSGYKVYKRPLNPFFEA